MRSYECNRAANSSEVECLPTPRVVVIGLASCFGCQLQITNMEQHLMDVVGQFELVYWQLASSEPMPQEYDVAVIEGAVTTLESMETVRQLRHKAKTIITIGACANTAGIPGIAAAGFNGHSSEVYSQGVPNACGQVIAPRSVESVIQVDYQVPCCPIDFYDFSAVLSRALYGSNRTVPNRTMCGDCKRNETQCFFEKGELCLGLVTKGGCGARCPKLGRPCFGCAGLSKDANLDAARDSVARYGIEVAEFESRLQLFNQTNEALCEGAKGEYHA